MELTTTDNVNSPMGCSFNQDLALVHACKNGDLAAFEQLVKRYQVRIFSIAWVRCWPRTAPRVTPLVPPCALSRGLGIP